MDDIGNQEVIQLFVTFILGNRTRSDPERPPSMFITDNIIRGERGEYLYDTMTNLMLLHGVPARVVVRDSVSDESIGSDEGVLLGNSVTDLEPCVQYGETEQCSITLDVQPEEQELQSEDVERCT